MIKLKIRRPGLMIELPGIPATRTPTIIDVSKIDLNIVKLKLKQYGISDYEIISLDGVATRHPTKRIVKKGKSKTKTTMIQPDLSSLEERFDQLEKLIHLIADRPVNVEVHGVQQVLPGQEGSTIIEELETDSFIPEIDDELELTGDIVKTSDSVVDIDDAVTELRNLQKGVQKFKK